MMTPPTWIGNSVVRGVGLVPDLAALQYDTEAKTSVPKASNSRPAMTTYAGRTSASSPSTAGRAAGRAAAATNHFLPPFDERLTITTGTTSRTTPIPMNPSPPQVRSLSSTVPLTTPVSTPIPIRMVKKHTAHHAMTAPREIGSDIRAEPVRGQTAGAGRSRTPRALAAALPLQWSRRAQPSQPRRSSGEQGRGQ